MAINIRGHDVNLISELPHMFKCPLCNLLMRDAIQTYRGDRACEFCYYDAKEKGYFSNYIDCFLIFHFLQYIQANVT